MNTFTVNKKTYTAAPFTYNTICDLEDRGISLDAMEQKPMSMVRAYFAMCARMGKAQAGAEIEKHLIAGGSLNDVMEAMRKEMDESGFFRAMSERQEKEGTGTEET